MLLPYVVPVALYGHGWRWALLALASFPLALHQHRLVRSGITGADLVPVLKATGLIELLFAVFLAMGLAFAPV